MKKVFTLSSLIFLLILGLSCTPGDTSDSGSDNKTVSSESLSKPSEEGARQLAEKYYELIGRYEYEKVFDQLRSKDKKLVDKDAFLNRLRQSNEGLLKTSIVSVTLMSDDKAEISATQEIEGFESTETIMRVNFFSFDSANNSWHPYLSKPDLFFYGADPDELGIIKAAVLERLTLPLFDAEVLSANRDDTLNESGQKSVLVQLKVTNKAKNGGGNFIFDPGIYTALSDFTQLLTGPDKELSAVVRIEPDNEANVSIIFPTSNTELSILIGSDDNYYLVPLGF